MPLEIQAPSFHSAHAIVLQQPLGIATTSTVLLSVLMQLRASHTTHPGHAHHTTRTTIIIQRSVPTSSDVPNFCRCFNNLHEHFHQYPIFQNYFHHPQVILPNVAPHSAGMSQSVRVKRELILINLASNRTVTYQRSFM